MDWTTVIGVITVATIIRVFEHYCKTGFVAPTFTRWFSESKKSDPSQVKRDVAQAIVKVIGTVHVLIQIPLALSVLADPRMRSDRLYATSPRSTMMLIISGGYFLHDVMTTITNYSDWGFVYLLHAFCCCTLYTFGAGSGFLHYFGAAFLLWEISTPFVYVRWFMWKMDKNKMPLYLYNGVLMVVTFFLFRVIGGTVLSFEYWRVTQLELSHPRPGGIPVAIIYLYRVFNIALNGLNLFWFSKMFTGLISLLKGGNPDKTHQT